jgi:hypothetical protein
VPLAFLPDANVGWIVVPEAAAGFGMGLALLAAAELAGGAETATPLAIRHAGITLALLALAPIVAHDLSATTRRAKLDGVALLLQARLSTVDKIRIAPPVFSAIRATTPRSALKRTAAQQRRRIPARDRGTFDRVAARADTLLVSAIADAFSHAFLVAAAFAVGAVAVALVAGGVRATGVVLASAVAAAVAAAVYHHGRPPTGVQRADACAGQVAQGTDRVGRIVVKALDRLACSVHASPEEIVLAFADEGEARRFERTYGINPRSIFFLLRALTG